MAVRNRGIVNHSIRSLTVPIRGELPRLLDLPAEFMILLLSQFAHVTTLDNTDTICSSWAREDRSERPKEMWLL